MDVSIIDVGTDALYSLYNKILDLSISKRKMQRLTFISAEICAKMTEICALPHVKKKYAIISP